MYRLRVIDKTSIFDHDAVKRDDPVGSAIGYPLILYVYYVHWTSL
jgi:hypothetical protein